VPADKHQLFLSIHLIHIHFDQWVILY